MEYFPTIEITPREARRLVVICTALHRRKRFGAGTNAVRDAIRHLGYVQIDTISVVNRAHHHVLWSRVPSYHPQILDKLQDQNREIFEYWAHAASFLPIEDYRYSLIRKNFFRREEDRWPKSDKGLKAFVLKRITEEGPLMAKDFKGPKRGAGGWWNLKPAKWALERLFMEGHLMVKKRIGFQKVYDLADRVIPEGIDRSVPTKSAFIRYLCMNYVRSFGLISAEQVAYLRLVNVKEVQQEIHNLIEDGMLVAVSIGRKMEDIKFTTREALDQLSHKISNTYKIISPFDNLVIQRKLIKSLFDFDYQIECYLPQHKRKYGYFSLPMVYGDRLIGRADMKAHKQSGCLDVKYLHLEENWPSKYFLPEKMAQALRDFASFNQCHHIIIRQSNIPGFMAALREKLD